MEKLSIIIPTLQRNKDVLDMLIYQLDKDNCVGEIIVIDNSLQGYHYKSNKVNVIIPENNLFVNQSWNLGVEKSQYNYFGILNDDILISDNLCSDILEFLKNTDNAGLIGVESSTVIDDKKRDCSEYPTCKTSLKFKSIENIRSNKNFYWGCAIFGDKKNYYRIPNDMKIYCGDDYLLYKNAKNGKTNYAFYNTVINHCHSLSSSSKEFKQIIQNDMQNYAKIDSSYKKYLQRKSFMKIMQKIFSIQNTKNRKHKVYTICGIKIKIRNKTQKPIKLLVHLHLYYHEQLDFMLDKLNNITNCDWDLCVTVNKNNNNTTQKITDFKPNTKIIEVDNLGYDIWPFIQCLRSIEINNYDYVLKIHTKNINKPFSIRDFKYKGNFLKGTFWRDQLLDALINTKKRFEKNLNLLSNNPKIGMIANKTFMLELTDFMAEDTYLLDELKSRLNITSSYKQFIAGTMFIIKAEVLKKLIDSDLNANDFIVENGDYATGAEGQFVHAIERIFTQLTDEAGYQIYKIPHFKMEIYHFFRSLIKNIFSLENTRDKSHKTLTIFGFSAKIKRKIAT